MGSKSSIVPFVKPGTVACVVPEGQTLAEALRAAWDKAHTSK
jgi:hypothetical protein